MWRYLPGQREESVHLALFRTAGRTSTCCETQSSSILWARLIKVRDLVLAHIEPLRKDKQIGSSLQAKVVLSGGGSEMALLKDRADELPMLFIVSEVELRPDGGDTLKVDDREGFGREM